MANSSDWIEALDEDSPEVATDEPAWLAALREPAEFIEGAPFGDLMPATSPQSGPHPTSEGPIAEPDEPQEEEPDLIAQAFDRGLAQGRADAIAERSTEEQLSQKLRLKFRIFDQAASDAFASELAETVIDLCSKALADFAADSETLLDRCNQAAARLGSAAAECKLHLHPDDLAALDPAALEGWDVVADESIARAGLRFEGPDGAVSHGPEDWRRAIAAALRG